MRGLHRSKKRWPKTTAYPKVNMDGICFAYRRMIECSRSTDSMKAGRCTVKLAMILIGLGPTLNALAAERTTEQPTQVGSCSVDSVVSERLIDIRECGAKVDGHTDDAGAWRSAIELSNQVSHSGLYVCIVAPAGI